MSLVWTKVTRPLWWGQVWWLRVPGAGRADQKGESPTPGRLGDARCDGRDELIAKLEQHGASVLRSATSEELALRFFLQFGPAALPELHGDFSFVLWKPR